MLGENKIPRLAIYYIATSNYKAGFEFFNKNLHYFYPEFNKTVVILSDGLTEWDKVISKNPEGTEINYEVYHIDHFCWPIIALFKMKLILDHKIDCDYVCYFNANLQFNKDYDYSTNNIDLTGLNLSRPCTCNENSEFDGSGFAWAINKKSQAYIEEPYTYISGGLFLGPPEIVYKMCEEVNEMVEIDLNKNIIPQWHDESYLNKWRLQNKTLVIPPKKIISYERFVWNKPFAIIETIEKDRRTDKRYFN